MSGSFPGFNGNFKFRTLFLHPDHMKFPEITGNFIRYMEFLVQGHVTFTWHFLYALKISCVL